MKIWKVTITSSENYIYYSVPCQKPIGWNFATSGSTNLHAFNNKIVAVSDNDVSLAHSLCVHTIVNLYFDRHFLSTRTYRIFIMLSYSRTLILPTTLQITKHSDGEFVSSHGNRMSVKYLLQGFSAGGTNMLFESNHIQNGDDCLTIGNGAKNIHFRSVSEPRKGMKDS